jgi:hypothetical protein
VSVEPRTRMRRTGFGAGCAFEAANKRLDKTGCERDDTRWEIAASAFRSAARTQPDIAKPHPIQTVLWRGRPIRVVHALPQTRHSPELPYTEQRKWRHGCSEVVGCAPPLPCRSHRLGANAADTGASRRRGPQSIALRQTGDHADTSRVAQPTLTREPPLKRPKPQLPLLSIGEHSHPRPDRPHITSFYCIPQVLEHRVGTTSHRWPIVTRLRDDSFQRLDCKYSKHRL